VRETHLKQKNRETHRQASSPENDPRGAFYAPYGCRPAEKGEETMND
jgi:hypothetical protein